MNSRKYKNTGSCSSSDAGDDVARATPRFTPMSAITNRPPSAGAMIFDRLYAYGGVEGGNNMSDDAQTPSRVLKGAGMRPYPTLTPADRIGMANDSSASPTRQRVKAPIGVSTMSFQSQHQNDWSNPADVSLRVDQGDNGSTPRTCERISMPFWKKLQAAEAAKASRTDNALEVLSQNTHLSSTFDAKIRYLHGQTIALVENGKRKKPNAPWTGGSRGGGDYVNFGGTAKSNNKYEMSVKQAHQLQENKLLQRKVDRDRLGKAIQCAKGKLQREAILSQKPYLAPSNNDDSVVIPSADHRDPYVVGPSYSPSMDHLSYDYVPPNEMEPQHFDATTVRVAGGGANNGGGKAHFRSEHIEKQYKDQLDHTRKLRYQHPRAQQANFNAASSSKEEEHDYYFVTDPRDVLDAEEGAALQQRLASQRAYLDSIRADAAALATDTCYTKEANHVDPSTNRRYPRMYSVVNEVDSDSSSDGEYFSLDQKPSNVMARMDSAKPRYKIPKAPLFHVDKRILAEMREKVRLQQEKDSRPRQVFATACGPMPSSSSLSSVSPSSSRKGGKEGKLRRSSAASSCSSDNIPSSSNTRPQTAPIQRREPTSTPKTAINTKNAHQTQQPKQPTPVLNAPLDQPSTANQTPRGIPNQQLNLFHGGNTFREALPHHLLLSAQSTENTPATVLSSGNIHLASRPHSVMEHMHFIKKAEAFSKGESVTHNGEHRGVIPTTTTANNNGNKMNGGLLRKTPTSATPTSANLHHLLESRRINNGSVMSTAGGVLTVPVGTPTPPPPPHLSSSSAETPIFKIASTDHSAAPSTSNSRAGVSSVGGHTNSSMRLGTAADSPTMMHGGSSGGKGLDLDLAKVSSEASRNAVAKGGVPQTARAKLGEGVREGGDGASDDVFIIPTRPSASSRPPTATRRPQSASLRR